MDIGSAYKGKKVLVAGGTGMIGIQLVKLLLDAGADVRITSLDDPSRAHPDAEFLQLNAMSFDNCAKACADMDIVFNLLGVKGSPAAVMAKPATVFVSAVTMNLNMLEAARQAGAEGILQTSSIGVYAPAEVFHEDDVWKTFPSENDKFGGWAKRIAELQVESYALEFDWHKLAIVRPANVYGPYDNFDSENAMVIPSLIKRAVSGENPFVVWGDGSPVRDFIHSRDVARGMMLAAAKWPEKPINLGCGEGVSIRELVEVIVANMDATPEIVWDASKPKGDAKRLMDISRAREIGFEPVVSLDEGIKEVMEWYAKSRNETAKRYDVFDKGSI